METTKAKNAKTTDIIKQVKFIPGDKHLKKL